MIKTWTGKHPEEVARQAEKDIGDAEIVSWQVIAYAGQYCLTVEYKQAAKPVMRCG